MYFFKNGLIHGYFMVANNEALGVIVVTVLSPPRMLLHEIDSDSFGWVNSQNLADKVLKLDWDMTWDAVLSIQNLSIQFGGIFVLEGKEAADHGKEDDPCTPDIHHQRLVRMLALDHLGGCVAWWSASCSQSFLRLVGIGESEVNYSNGLVIVDEAVLQFEIPMNYPEFMDIFDSTDDLFEYFAGLFLWHPLLADDVVKQFPAFHEFHD